MPKLTPRPTNRVLRALQRAGWSLRPAGGARHYVLIHPSLPGIVTAPRHPLTRKSTLAHIIKAARLTLDEFESLYR